MLCNSRPGHYTKPFHFKATASQVFLLCAEETEEKIFL
jgi:hypothetical protein